MIVEDVRQADMALKEYGMTSDRITHHEVMSSAGTEHTGKLLKGDYTMLWISTPCDYSTRLPTAKQASHWQRLQNWIKKACVLGMVVVMFGQPGFLWKIPSIMETIQEHNMCVVRMRLCHFGYKYDPKETKPSGSYLQIASTAKICSKTWQCNCNVKIEDHHLDWYGRQELRAEWRRRVAMDLLHEACKALGLQKLAIGMHRGNAIPNTPSRTVHIIQDNAALPLSIDAEPIQVLPTDAREKQKQRHKANKEADPKWKPTKKYKVVEHGKDDCGDDIG